MNNSSAATAPKLVDKTISLNNEMGTDEAEKLLVSHPEIFDFSPTLTEGYYNLVLAQERDEFTRIENLELTPSAAFADIIESSGRQSYNRVSDIFDWLDFANCKRMTMIGCGQLPVTAFHVHDRTNIEEIVSIDVRQEAIDSVTYLSAKLGMNRIRPQLGDGAAVDYKGSQIVYVANMVRGKDAVLRRIRDTAPADVQIVIREPVGFGQLWTDRLRDTATLGFKVADRGPVFKYLSQDHLITRI